MFSIFYFLFINMGRKSLNKTYEQVLEENRIRSKQYYELNKNEIIKKAMKRYNQLKSEYENRNLQDNK
jgi:predicted solute-binding protein